MTETGTAKPFVATDAAALAKRAKLWAENCHNNYISNTSKQWEARIIGIFIIFPFPVALPKLGFG